MYVRYERTDRRRTALSVRSSASWVRRALVASSIVWPVSTSVLVADIHVAPSAEEARKSALDWVTSRQINDRGVMERIGVLWAFGDESRNATEILDRVIQTFCFADPETKQFVEECTLMNAPLVPPNPKRLDDNDIDPFYSANLRLFYGRYLCHRRMYEMALDILAPINVSHVVDPASFFFFKAVCEHALLRKSDGLSTLKELLENTQGVPARYTSVAKLMQPDLQALKDDSLDGIARRMSDVERRLDLGRGGEKVQKVEEDIVAALDKLIQKMEEEQKQSQKKSAGSGQGNQIVDPAQDSRIKGTTAPGEVESKDIGSKGGWGALPPKQAVRAKNLINREFPVHYRRAVEEYFRKLAKRRGSQGRSQP
jgi:hypothetical protein